MQISEAAGGQPAPGAEPCRFPKLEECAHFHYERVRLPQLGVSLKNNMDQSLHSQHTNEEDADWYMIQVTSGEECWLVQRNFENFKMLDAQLHQCIYDRKISQLPDLSFRSSEGADIENVLCGYLDRFGQIADNSLNCGPVLNWLQMDNKGHRLLVPSEESRSINTPAVAAAYSVRRYVSQARDELNLEVGDMISVIDMASPGESMWWRGKRGFQVGFFPQHCVHIIGDKVPRNMPLPPPVVGSLAITSIKPVLRKHGKLITFFRSFILNRPSRRRLKQSGILKERVFACDLGEHLLNSGHEIPTVLKCCAEFIEKNGIVDGIYRLSGITSNIQKLRNAFDEDRVPNLYTEEILQDIHSVASLLKMYFRELPNPLCTYQLYQSFVNAVQNTGVKGTEGDRERLLKMREAVQKLPPPHYRTLEYLMRHLAKVAKHGPSTGMTTRNVAIVWAPNLLRCAELEDGGVTALQGVGVQAVVTEYLICYADLIFCDRLPDLDRPLLERAISAPSCPSPKKCRPKSLALATPTKLITLEEARNKRLLGNVNNNKMNGDVRAEGDDELDVGGYIEVGGGPKNLPKKYHTVIELPHGARKRGHPKRSPSGWRSFFTKSRNSAQNTLKITRKTSSAGLSKSEKAIAIEPEMVEVRRKLRSVKSAESLTSGHSEPGPGDNDVLGPLHTLHKPAGHNRSISHDSYFDTLQQNSQHNSENSLLDLSEIQLNFDLEETEMRIFSEDESLVSSPRVQRESGQRRVLTRSRPDDGACCLSGSGNPSPKKQARVVIVSGAPSSSSSPTSRSPGAQNTAASAFGALCAENERCCADDAGVGCSRKRTRLEDQLSDIQFIDCNTPDLNMAPPPSGIGPLMMMTSLSSTCNLTTTTAIVHSEDVDKSSGRCSTVSSTNSESMVSGDTYRPKSKSSRNSDNLDKRQSLDLDLVVGTTAKSINNKNIVKSYTENDLEMRVSGGADGSPIFYRALCADASSDDGLSGDISYNNLDKSPLKTEFAKAAKTLNRSSTSPNYENVLTTISITYKSPPRSLENSPTKTAPNTFASIYENVTIIPEKAMVPTSAATLPIQQASQPELRNSANCFLPLDHNKEEDRPKSLSALDNVKRTASCGRGGIAPSNLSANAIYDTNEQLSMLLSTDELKSSSSNRSSRSNVQYTPSPRSTTPHRHFATETTPPTTDFSMSEVRLSSAENLTIDSCRTSISFPLTSPSSSSSKNLTPNVSPTHLKSENTRSLEELLSSSPLEEEDDGREGATSADGYVRISANTRESSLLTDESSARDDLVYEQVKHFRRSICEVNALLDLEEKSEGVETGKNGDVTRMARESGETPMQISDASLDEEMDVTEHKDKTGEESAAPKRDSCGTGSSIEKQSFGNVAELVEKFRVSEMKNAPERGFNVIATSKKNRDNEEQPQQMMEEEEEEEMVNYDSLEPEADCHVYENVLGEDMRNGNLAIHRPSDDSGDVADFPVFSGKLDTESGDVADPRVFSADIPKVRDLASKFFEEDDDARRTNRRSYEKDALPPCLRARNLKYRLKTRSLDEEEFKKDLLLTTTTVETVDGAQEAALRRKSLDETTGVGYKTNSLPKRLNQPKFLPEREIDNEAAVSLHLSHSSENLRRSMELEEEEMRKRERIEKYKEERRKVLQEKYRTESFKDDKDSSLLRTRMKIYKSREDVRGEHAHDNSPGRVRTRSARSGDDDDDDLLDHKPSEDDDIAEETSSSRTTTVVTTRPPPPPVVTTSLKARAAIFERNGPPTAGGAAVIVLKKPPAVASTLRGGGEGGVRKGGVVKSRENVSEEIRRHTYEENNSRERIVISMEKGARRGSLDERRSPRKEKAASPSYCIKDMKALFESKSK